MAGQEDSHMAGTQAAVEDMLVEGGMDNLLGEVPQDSSLEVVAYCSRYVANKRRGII